MTYFQSNVTIYVRVLYYEVIVSRGSYSFYFHMYMESDRDIMGQRHRSDINLEGCGLCSLISLL